MYVNLNEYYINSFVLHRDRGAHGRHVGAYDVNGGVSYKTTGHTIENVAHINGMVARVAVVEGHGRNRTVCDINIDTYDWNSLVVVHMTGAAVYPTGPEGHITANTVHMTAVTLCVVRAMITPALVTGVAK